MDRPYKPHDTVPAALDAPGAVLNPAPASSIREADALWRELQAAPDHHAPHLGEALLQAGLLRPQQLHEALRYQAIQPEHLPLGEVLIQLGLITPAQMRQVLAHWMGIPTVDLSRFAPEPEALTRVHALIATREGALPLMVRGDTLVVAMNDPWDHRLLEMLRFTSELRVRPVLATPGTLSPALARAYRMREDAAGSAPNERPSTTVAAPTSLFEMAEELQRTGGDAADAVVDVVSESDNTLVRLVNRLISDAIDLKASDIHIETDEPPLPVCIRMRVDGDLRRHLELPPRVRFALVARLKIMADLDIAEHRRPQDGKLDFARFGGPHMELRMVTVPTSGGLEDVVLRLLGGVKPLPLSGIGLAPENLEALQGLMAKPHGLLLICGPTGCGKTTTLHSVMRELNQEHRKIWTAEDPIEITQPGLRQVQVNPRIGWTFAAAMRTFLRADPDVVMIGEMRDEETARIAVEASLTGHLVMSTLHTNSAPEAVTRLLEIGLDPFMFSDSLLGVLAQRLVRRLCPDCRMAEPLQAHTERSLARLYLGSVGETTPEAEDDLIARWRGRPGHGGRLLQYRRHGCHACGGTGYRGRLGLHELAVANDALRELIRHRASARDMFAAARDAGMRTLRQDGIDKVLQGLTDLPEVLAATAH